MSNYEQTVFISYAWGGEREEIVDQIDKALQKRGIKITRDKRDLEYKGSIKEFMERIGQGSSVIVYNCSTETTRPSPPGLPERTGSTYASVYPLNMLRLDPLRSKCLYHETYPSCHRG